MLNSVEGRSRLLVYQVKEDNVQSKSLIYRKVQTLDGRSLTLGQSLIGIEARIFIHLLFDFSEIGVNPLPVFWHTKEILRHKLVNDLLRRKFVSREEPPMNLDF